MYSFAFIIMTLLTTTSHSFSTITRQSAIQMWDNAIVPYQISTDFTSEETAVIEKTLQEIREETCVQFKFITFGETKERDYVRFLKSRIKCISYGIGKIGGPQTVFLRADTIENCVHHGQVAHQLMTTLGFYPEHLRPDRDTYVDILWGNVRKDKRIHFNKYNTTLFDPSICKYDYGSVTHAGLHKHSSRGDEMTIAPKEYGVSIGQRKGFSAGDIQKIKSVYCGGGGSMLNSVTVYLFLSISMLKYSL